MNKKKIISSLTIAGMIASAGMSNAFAADEDTATTPALGEFTKLIEGSNVTAIPFKLQSESDRVTGKDLMIAYPGKLISVEANQVLKTGDVVRIGGQPRTIVIYGDVNRDGAVDIYDVTKVVDNVANESHKLTGVELAAADLNRDGVADIYDITRVVSTISGETYASMNVTLPQEEVAKISNIEIPNANQIDVKFDYSNGEDYTFTVTDNKKGKNITVTKADFKLKDKKTILTLEKNMVDIATDRDQTYTLTIKDKSGKVVSENKNFVYTKLNEIESATVDTDNTVKTIINTDNVNNLAVKVKLAADTTDATDKSNLVSSTVSVTLIDTAQREVIGTATLPAGANEVIVNNFSGVDKLENGTITVKVEVLDESGNIVKKTSGVAPFYNFTKDTEALKIGNIEATRSGNLVTALKVNMIGKDKLATETVNGTRLVPKAYVKILPTGVVAPTRDAIIDKDEARDIASDGVITLRDEQNLKDSNASVTGYTVYVVVENAKGVLSDVASTTLPVAIPSTTLDKVTNIKAIATQPGNFEWKDDKNKDSSKISGYQVKLYAADNSNMNNPVLVTTKTVSAGTKTVNFLQEIKEYIQDHNKGKDNQGIWIDSETPNLNFSIEVISMGSGESVKNSESTKLTLANGSTAPEGYVAGQYVYSAERLATPIIANANLTFNDDKHLILGYVPDASDLGDFVGFDVNIYKYDEEGVPASEPCAKGSATREKKECDLTQTLSSQEEGKYLVKIVAISSGSTKADSLESDGMPIYYLKSAPEVTINPLSATSFEVKFYDVDDLLVKGDENKFAYDLTIERITASGTKTDKTITTLTPSSTQYDKDNSLYTLLKENVNSETKYDAYVTVKYVNQPIAESEEKEITTIKAPITTYNGTSVDTYIIANTKNNANEFYYDDDDKKLYKAGVLVDDSSSNYSDIVALVDKLETGDTVKIDKTGKVTEVEVKSIEEVDFGTILKDGTLKVSVTTSTATNRPIINGTFDKVEVKSNVEFLGTVQENITLLADNLNVKVPAKSVVTIDRTANGNSEINSSTINDISLSNIKDSKIKVTAIDNGISIGDLSKSDDSLNVSASDEAVVEFTGNQGKTVNIFNGANDDEVLTVKSENPVDLLIVQNSKTVDIENVKYKECKINNHAEVTFMTKKTLKFGTVDYTIDPSEKVTVKHDKTTDSASDRNITITGKAEITFTVNSDSFAKPTLNNEDKLVIINPIAAGDSKKLGVDSNNNPTDRLEVTASQAGANYYVDTDHKVVLQTESVGGVISIHIFNS